MAKGDSQDAQTQINTQGGQMQNVLNNNLQRTDALYNTFNGNFQTQYPANLMQQSGLMNQYSNFLGGGNQNPPSQSGYGPSGGSSQAPATFASLGGGDPTQLINQYFQAAGVDPSKAAYWTSPQMQALYKQDPNYFQTRLLNGLATDNGGNMSAFGSLQGSGAGGWGSGTPGYGPGGVGGNAMLGGALGPALGGYGMGASALGPAMSTYGDFAQTGGFTPQGIQDIRARDIAPTRAIYENAQNDLARQRELQGGYFPGYATAQDRLARQMSNQIADINTNANAGIAQMIQQGRLAGAGGLSGIGMGSLGGLQNMGLQGLSNQLTAMGGMNQLYGTTPAIAALTGNQTLNANAQNLEGSQLQNQAGLGLIQSQINKSQIPGNFQQAMGNIGSVLGLGGQVAGAFGGIPSFGGGSNLGGMTYGPSLSQLGVQGSTYGPSGAVSYF